MYAGVGLDVGVLVLVDWIATVGVFTGVWVALAGAWIAFVGIFVAVGTWNTPDGLDVGVFVT